MKKISIVIVAIIAVILVMSGFSKYNSIISMDESANAAWSQVLNQYQRRTDLIPNLVETVKGYAAHEQETLQSVVEARAKATQTTVNADMLSNEAAMERFQAAQSQLSSALSRLMVVVEKYPDLKANENFLALQSQLEGTENRITVARQDYIHAIQAFNLSIRTFPGNIISNWFLGFEPKANFDIPVESQSAPEVSFAK